MDKKPYTPPRIIPYVPDQVPEWIVEHFQNGLGVSDASKPRVAPIYTTVVDSDRKYVWVSDNFCELLGYKIDELVGKRYDEVTAPKTRYPRHLSYVQEARIHAWLADVD
jgi:PAS domain-containing protein